MRTLIAAAVAATMMGAGVASAEPLARVDDPTPNKQFTGTYDCSYWEKQPDGTKKKVTKSCEAKGYIAVYQDGVVACQGNEKITRPDGNKEPLQGYIWIGANHAASSKTGATPGNEVGAGNNRAADREDTDANEAHGPCEDKNQ